MSATRAEAPSQKPVSARERLRVAEGAEQHVDERQVGVVVAMHAARMVQRVALGSLHEVAQPARRAHVGVLEDRQEGVNRMAAVAACGGTPMSVSVTLVTSVQPDHVERAEPEGAGHIEPFGAVVHLVQQPEQRRPGMHRAVIGVGAQFVDQHAGRRPPARSASPTGRTTGSAPAPRPTAAAGTTTASGRARTTPTSARQPAAHARQRASGRQALPQHQAGKQRKHDQRQGVEQDVEWRGHGGLVALRMKCSARSLGRLSRHTKGAPCHKADESAMPDRTSTITVALLGSPGRQRLHALWVPRRAGQRRGATGRCCTAGPTRPRRSSR